MEAVEYLHSLNIVHRDLKLENIFLRAKNDLSSILVGDFGLANIIEIPKHPFLKTFIGTEGYQAPEILLGNEYGKPVDIWAIGIIAYTLLSGKFPFDSSNVDYILSNPILFHNNEDFDENCWDCKISSVSKCFIKKCLQIDPIKRISAESGKLLLNTQDSHRELVLPKLSERFSNEFIVKKRCRKGSNDSNLSEISSGFGTNSSPNE